MFTTITVVKAVVMTSALYGLELMPPRPSTFDALDHTMRSAVSIFHRGPWHHLTRWTGLIPSRAMVAIRRLRTIGEAARASNSPFPQAVIMTAVKTVKMDLTTGTVIDGVFLHSTAALELWRIVKQLTSEDAQALLFEVLDQTNLNTIAKQWLIDLDPNQLLMIALWALVCKFKFADVVQSWSEKQAPIGIVISDHLYEKNTSIMNFVENIVRRVIIFADDSPYSCDETLRKQLNVSDSLHPSIKYSDKYSRMFYVLLCKELNPHEASGNPMCLLCGLVGGDTSDHLFRHCSGEAGVEPIDVSPDSVPRSQTMQAYIDDRQVIVDTFTMTMTPLQHRRRLNECSSTKYVLHSTHTWKVMKKCEESLLALECVGQFLHRMYVLRMRKWKDRTQVNNDFVSMNVFEQFGSGSVPSFDSSSSSSSSFDNENENVDDDQETNDDNEDSNIDLPLLLTDLIQDVARQSLRDDDIDDDDEQEDIHNDNDNNDMSIE